MKALKYSFSALFVLIPEILFATCPQYSNVVMEKIETIFNGANSKEQEIELNYQDYFFENNYTRSSEFLNYRAKIESHTNTNWRFLLEKQKEIWSKAGADISLYDQILSGEYGKIEPINCLESIFFQHHLLEFGATTYYSEYSIMVLKKYSKLKILFTSSNSPSINWSKNLMNRLENYTNSNWEYLYLLHNHPFNFNNSSYGDIGGTLIPSGNESYGDIKITKDHFEIFGAQKAKITNGFDTINISSSN